MPQYRVGIRKESEEKRFERRTPLTPDGITALKHDHPELQFVVQPSQNRGYRYKRAFPDEAYRNAGAILQDSLSDCDAILGIKEIPIEDLLPGMTYAFFSHTCKGQPYNMPMFRRMMELGCTLVDYELIESRDPKTGKTGRSVHFGHWAGIAGALTSLATLNLRLAAEGYADHPLDAIRQAMAYSAPDEPFGDLALGLAGVRAAGERIRREGFPAGLAPVVLGVTGNGHTARGALKVFDALGAERIEPEGLTGLVKDPHPTADRIFYTQFLRRHTANPDRFRNWLAHITLLINGITWLPGEPRLVDRAFAAAAGVPGPGSLRVIGDVSCDPGGSIEFSKPTYSDRAAYTYIPEKDSDHRLDWLDPDDRTVLFESTCLPEVSADGINVMAVTNLPCALPRESSAAFSRMLRPHVPVIARLSHAGTLDSIADHPPVHNAVLLFRGMIPPEYSYLHKFVEAAQIEY